MKINRVHKRICIVATTAAVEIQRRYIAVAIVMRDLQ